MENEKKSFKKIGEVVEESHEKTDFSIDKKYCKMMKRTGFFMANAG